MSVTGLALGRWRLGLSEAAWAQRLVDAVPLLPVGLSMLVLGVALLPEITVPVPSLNDDAAHYSLILNASRAIDAGQNPFDHWAPDLEIGYPQFAYYQHLPHLFVVALHKATFGFIGLLTLFNVTRYGLLVALPMTVYWSLRQLEFSRPAAGAAAALAPLISAGHKFGLEYDSYVWRGFGMYTQLWAMHLSFIALALAYRTLRDGKGYFWSVAALAALVLSHVIYAFIAGLTLGLVLLAGLRRDNVRQRVARLALIGAPAIAITAYFWLPLIVNGAYHTTSPYMEDWKYDSHGASTVMSWLVQGELFDYNRPPVITAFGALGVVVALWTRTRLALLALAIFGIWLLAYFGRPTWGGFADVISFDGKLWMHRFIGPVQIGGIMLVAVAAGGLWTALHRFKRVAWLPPVAFGVVIVALTITALSERWLYLDKNREWMNDTEQALAADTDLQMILAVIEASPPGRVFAGTRSGFNDDIKIASLRVQDVLTFNQIETVAPPYQSLSLNSDLVWHFDHTNRAHYEVLHARYVILPADLAAPDFLTPMLDTERYHLYEAPSGGYVGLAETPEGFTGPEEDYHIAARAWFLGQAPARGIYPAFALPGTPRLEGLAYQPFEGASSAIRALRPEHEGALGAVVSEDAGKYAYEATVRLDTATTVFLKATYHPDWNVTVDGEAVDAFMVAPSFPAVQLGPGEHVIRFEYRAAAIRTPLLLLGAATLGLVAVADAKRDWLRAMLARIRR